MKLISVNVGLPRAVEWHDQVFRTSIFKSPTTGPIALRKQNLDGDRQADLSVHGGPHKVVYAYPVQHYAYWREQLPDVELVWGHFGENFTVEGMDEESICIGDEFAVGSARVVVTQPRMPCFKLGVRFDRADMPKRFLESLRSGFYLGVVEEGLVQAGDAISLLSKHPDRLSVREVTSLHTTERGNVALLKRAIAVTALPESWIEDFEQQLARLGA